MTYINFSRALAALAALAFSASGACAQDEAQHLRTIDLHAGIYIIKAEVAQTPREREIGLMWRTGMATHEGMLFAFEDAGVQCFWMRNTLIPLSAAFIADDGSIVNIAEMAPKTETSHCSDKPVRFVLEMNKGWFAKRGFKPGFKLTGAPFSN